MFAEIFELRKYRMDRQSCPVGNPPGNGNPPEGFHLDNIASPYGIKPNFNTSYTVNSGSEMVEAKHVSGKNIFWSTLTV